MKFFAFISLLILSFFDYSLADSDTFNLTLYAPDTVLSNASIYVGDDNKIYAANNTTPISGFIANNGSLLIDGTQMGIGKNYLALTNDSSTLDLAVPFSIVKGYLKLYANDFHALPSDDTGIYVLGNANAGAGRDEVIPVAIKAVGSDSKTIKSFSAKSVTVSTSLSILDMTQTFSTNNGATSFQLNFYYFVLTLTAYIF